jgi:hypothetical protein
MPTPRVASEPNALVATKALLLKYITKNSEYLVADGVCVAVQRRRPGRELQTQGAQQRVLARVRALENGGHEVVPGNGAEIGDCLLLGGEGKGLLTSPIAQIITDEPLDAHSRR